MANILITGGCGFIGANLVKMLAGSNHKLTVYDNFSRGKASYLDNKLDVEIIEGDIRDEKLIQQTSDGKDVIVHLAAYGSVVESVQSPEENYSVNVFGTFSVLQAAKTADVKKVVFASTGGALIGNALPPVNEQSVPRPISPYGASKLAGEGYCCAFANSYDMSIIALRFANVVGPVSWHKKGAVTAFFKAILDQKPIVIYGDGSATRDFLYVTDLCRGICSAINADKERFNVYHLASGNEVSVSDLAKLVIKVAGVPEHPVIYEPKRKGEVEKNFANYELAKTELGFSPEYDLEQALVETWDWIQKVDPALM